MSRIFISYRRHDSAAHAGRLYDRLSAHFGANQIFMDTDDIPPGADFAADIEARVGSCDAMIVVIGKEWLTARNAAGQRRLSDPNDFVALEVSSILKRKALVIPVLVGGAQMPKADELPGNLKGLARRNALTISDQEFTRAAGDLIAALEKSTNLGNSTTKLASETARAELRQKLLRRMIWKVPVIVLLVSFAVWWEWRKQPANDSSFQASAAAFAGSWTGEVTYSWGAKHNETFFFQPEGGKLFGTVSFLGAKRGIEEGKIEGEIVSFYVRYEEMSGGESRQRKNYYWGKLNGKDILMRMQDDRGSPGVDWVLKKSSTPQ
jgi:hypothetical protein